MSYLSVGVPTYNQGHLLGACLDSLLTQNVSPREIVVSNNHSTDDTRNVLKSFERTGRIKVIEPPRHLTMMEHWNFLVSRMSGPWISLLSSDDQALPNYCQTFHDAISEGGSAVLIRAGWEVINEQDRVIDKRRLITVQKYTPKPHNFLEQLKGPKGSFAAFSVLKEAWSVAGGFPEECSLSGDHAMWLRLSPLGSFLYQDVIVARYRFDYRPGLGAERALTQASDDHFIFLHLIPEVAAELGLSGRWPKPGVLKAVLRSRLWDARALDADGRKSLADAYHSWAEHANVGPILDRYQGLRHVNIDTYPVRKQLRVIVRRAVSIGLRKR